MATTERDFEIVLDEEESTATSLLPQPMPDDLKEKGWKMSRSEGQYRARNDRLGLAGGLVQSPDEAIHQARELDAGKKMVVTPAGTTFEEKIADFSPSDEGEKSAIQSAPEAEPPPKRAHPPLAERTFDDEIAAARELLKDDPTRPRMISHTLFRLDGGTQPREQLDQSLIAEYAEAKKRGDVFPPVDVFFDDQWMWLAGGFHRYFSDKLLGRNETFANVHYGTRRDAVLFSLRENATHGLQRSNADKRRAVLTLLNDPEWSMWSDNVIAQKVRVSQPFVSSLRRELPQKVLSEPDDVTTSIGEETTSPLFTPQPTKRIGADGLVRETANIGRREPAREHGSEDRRIDGDIIPAENDIRVDEIADESEAAAAATTDAEKELWNAGMIDLHIRFRPAAKNLDMIIVSAKHTNTPAPVFKQFLAADLNPRPPALRVILRDLQEAFDNRGKSQPAATKPKKKTRWRAGKRS